MNSFKEFYEILAVCKHSLNAFSIYLNLIETFGKNLLFFFCRMNCCNILISRFLLKIRTVGLFCFYAFGVVFFFFFTTFRTTELRIKKSCFFFFFAWWNCPLAIIKCYCHNLYALLGVLDCFRFFFQINLFSRSLL